MICVGGRGNVVNAAVIELDISDCPAEFVTLSRRSVYLVFAVRPPTMADVLVASTVEVSVTTAALKGEAVKLYAVIG